MGLPILKYRGPDGQIYDIPAIRGAPGVSPTLFIEQVAAGVIVTITDEQGPHEFLIPKPTVPQEISDHIKDIDNPHGVTAEQVGLGNVNNTSDADKPVSTAVQKAMELKSDTNHSHDNSYLKISGGTVSGLVTFNGIIKVGSQNVGTSLPAAGNAGRIFLKRI